MTNSYRITTEHAASSYGQPVLVDARGQAYSPSEVGLDAIPSEIRSIALPNGYHSSACWAGPQVFRGHYLPAAGQPQDRQNVSWWDAICAVRAERPELDVIGISEDGIALRPKGICESLDAGPGGGVG